MSKRSGRVISILLSLPILLGLVGALVAVIKTMSDVAGKGYIAVTLDGKIVNDGDSLGTIRSGATFDIVSSGNFDVKIEAYAEQSNFKFTLGLEKGNEWKQIKGDISSMFTVTQTKTDLGATYALAYEDMDSMMTKHNGSHKITGATDNSDWLYKDIFRITFEGLNTISVTFGVIIDVEGIELAPNKKVV